MVAQRDPGSDGKRRPPATPPFGSGRREAHDASAFYARFRAPELSDDSNVGVSPLGHHIVCGDARDMSAIPDAPVALVVPSPPYFAGKAYEQELGEGHIPATYLDYLA